MKPDVCSVGQLIEATDWKAYVRDESETQELVALLRRLPNVDVSDVQKLSRQLVQILLHPMGCLLRESVPATRVIVEALHTRASLRREEFFSLLARFAEIAYEPPHAKSEIGREMREVLDEAGPFFLSLITTEAGNASSGLWTLVSYTARHRSEARLGVRRFIASRFNELVLHAAHRILKNESDWPDVLNRLYERHTEVGTELERLARLTLLLHCLAYSSSRDPIYNELSRLVPAVGVYELRQRETLLLGLPNDILIELLSVLMRDLPIAKTNLIGGALRADRVLTWGYLTLRIAFKDQRIWPSLRYANEALLFGVDSAPPPTLPNELTARTRGALLALTERPEIWQVPNNLLSIFGLTMTREELERWIKSVPTTKP